MALAATPALKTQIDTLANDFIHTLFSAQLNEGNLDSDPAQRQAQACAKFASDLSSAIETFIETTQWLITPGSLMTAGAPTLHSNTNTGVITKK